MTKKLTFLFAFLFLSNSGHAIYWEVIGQDSKDPVRQGRQSVDLKKSIGVATVEIFRANRIPFQGNEGGILSVFGTPTGDGATVIVSNDTMRVYGWCVEVDGVQPQVMPNNYFFPSQESVLRWFFAYSLYETGKWKNFCTPAYTKPLKFFHP